MSGKAWASELFLLRVAVSSLLLYSSAMHINNPYRFLEDVLGYQILPRMPALLVASFLPFLQANIAIGLLVERFWNSCFLLSAFLMCVFFVAQCSALFRQLEVACGCWGAAPTTVSPLSAGFTLIVGIICFIGFRAPAIRWFEKITGEEKAVVERVGLLFDFVVD